MLRTRASRRRLVRRPTRASVRLLLAVVSLVTISSPVLGAPGEVISKQKISATTGGLGAVLSNGDRFGISAAGLGDVDGDGIADLAVAADRDDDGVGDAGAVFVLFLNQNGTVAGRQKISATTGGFSGSLASGDQFGSQIAALGDLDGDGISELAVGAENHGDGGAARGAVWILFPASDGTVAAETKISDLVGGVTPDLADGDHFGMPTALGDLDGDGTTELAVGSWGDAGSGADTGAVWILFLLPDGRVHHVQKIASAAGGFTGVVTAGDRFGASTAGIGDLDGDGVPDLVVGADLDAAGGMDRGAVWVLFLNDDGRVKAHQKIDGTQGGFGGTLFDGDRFGRQLARLGDVNGDGHPDVAVGAAGRDGGGSDRGAVWVLFLDDDGTVVGETEIGADTGGFGSGLGDGDFLSGATALGDLDGDGVTELAVGAPLDDDGGLDRGAVYVLYLDGSMAICGDGVLDPGEACDDGNGQSRDGCDSTCAIEDELRLFGTAASSGVLSVDVSGVIRDTAVSIGDGPTLLAQRLATGINLDGVLMAAGVSAQAEANRVVTNGIFRSGTLDAEATSLSVAPGRVLGEAKISDTAGGFAGVLDDFDLFGTALAPLPDLDGNGVADLAVGTGSDDDGGAGRGAVWILFLNGDGSVASHQKISDTEGGFTGVLDDDDGFGGAVASLGDLDGDGVGDLAVGAFQDDDGGDRRGAVWILFLNPDGTVDHHRKISDTTGGFGGVLDDGDQFGDSVASLGDLDLDGVGDLAVGAVFDDDGGDARGAVWILFLMADGSVRSHQKISDTAGGFTGVLDDIDQFGGAVAGIGDLDGDRNVDLAVGADSDSDGGAFRGAVWILFLNADGTVAEHQKLSDLEGGFRGVLDDGDLFGRSVSAVGDLDGNGVPDVAVGAESDDDGGVGRGALWLLFLAADGTVSSHQKISDVQGGFSSGLDDGDLFGRSAASLGDLDFDGVAEMAVAAVSDDDGGDVRGAVWILSLDGAAAAFCGDSVRVGSEACDDANGISGDGCYATCDFEDEIEITGTGQGGEIQVVISGVLAVATTSPGESAASVAQALADEANGSAALATAGISAVAIDGRLITNGLYQFVQNTDPGLTVPEPGLATALAIAGLVLAGRSRRGPTSAPQPRKSPPGRAPVSTPARLVT